MGEPQWHEAVGIGWELMSARSGAASAVARADHFSCYHPCHHPRGIS
jgi:hypothetical protein